VARLGSDPVGDALHVDRSAAQVRQHRFRDGVVVVGQVELGGSVLGEEHLVRLEISIPAIGSVGFVVPLTQERYPPTTVSGALTGYAHGMRQRNLTRGAIAVFLILGVIVALVLILRDLGDRSPPKGRRAQPGLGGRSSGYR
jgi:hypothetical protein